MKKIGILCAGDDELAPFLPHLENAAVSEKAMLRVYDGHIAGVPAAALYSGAGKVNAAVAAQILIDAYGVDAILNAGTAGGMAAEAALFDTVISTQAAYHDMDDGLLTEFHPWLASDWLDADPALLETARAVWGAEKTVRFGRMVTGDAFIEDAGRERINRRYGPLSVDMETAAAAHVCHVNGVPFLAVRTITDTADHAGQAQFERNCKRASGIAKEIVLGILERLGEGR